MKGRKLPWHRWIIIASPTKPKSPASQAMADVVNSAPDRFMLKEFAQDRCSFYNEHFGTLARFEVKRIDKD